MIGIVRGVITLVLMFLFIALTVRVWGRQRKESFDSMARMPLEDDLVPPAPGPARAGSERS
jgi:cbb3-type cytochrome oxidase subunit 3